jgi:CDP-glucose 4,6-dehydratase
MGLVNLLEAMRAVPGIRAAVNITSDKCYENKETSHAFVEDNPMGGFDPYSSSKACAEIVTGAYRRSYFTSSEGNVPALASARAGNVIGGGDWAADRLIPDLIRSFERGEVAEIRNPHAIRPWQHVLEPLSGYLLLAQHLHTIGSGYAEGWNFGPEDDDAIPVSAIADRFVATWGEQAAWRTHSAPQLHEASMLRLSCDKAKHRLGWQPRWKIDIALEKVAKWHKAFNAGSDMRDFTLQQIHEYGCR